MSTTTTNNKIIKILFLGVVVFLIITTILIFKKCSFVLQRSCKLKIVWNSIIGLKNPFVL